MKFGQLNTLCQSNILKKNHAKNETGRLGLDLQMALHKVKANSLWFGVSIF